MRWFLGSLLLLVIALVFGLGLMAYAMYALLTIMLVSRWLSRMWADSLTAEREYSRATAEVGDSVAVVVTIRNRGWLPIPWVLIEDLLPRDAILFDPPRLRVQGRRVKLTMLRPRQGVVLLYQLQCNRRGYYQIGPLVLETGDVFGLHRRYRVVTEPHFLLVYPKVVPLSGFEIASRRPIGEVRMSYRLYEDPTRIAGVRQYERGDPLNRVHWRATARTGQLHSKVYEPSTVAGATLLMDFHQGSHESRHEPYRSDLAVNAAAAIANAVDELGQQVGLITNGRDAADRVRVEGWSYDFRSRSAARAAASMRSHSDRLQPVMVPTRRGSEQLMQILETLARLELTDGLTFPQLVGEATSRMPRDATIIAILPKVDDQVAITLGNLQRRGFAVTAILNVFEYYEFSDLAGPLVAQGIDVLHLRDEAAIVEICRQQVLR